MRDQRADPLENGIVSKVLAVVVAVTTGLAFVAGLRREGPADLPAVALDSSLLLDIERSFLFGALIAALLIFLVRAWSGYYPSKLSTTGAEYPDPSAFQGVATSGHQELLMLRYLRSQHVALSERTEAQMGILSARIGALETRLLELDDLP